MDKPEYKVIIAGTRTFINHDTIFRYAAYKLQNKAKTHKIIIVSGDCRGVDRVGIDFARSYGYEEKHFPAEWDIYRKSAGIRRNRQMAEYADALIAFWDGRSAGTKNMIDTARELGLSVAVYHIEKSQNSRIY